MNRRLKMVIAGPFMAILVMALDVPARSISISSGTNQIRAACEQAAAGDTILLVDPGFYHESDMVLQPLFALTIMADPNLDKSPTWTSSGSRHIRVRHDLSIYGIRFDGQKKTEHAIVNASLLPNRIVVAGCEFFGLRRNGITGRSFPIGQCVVQNSLFYDLGETGISFRIGDVCHDLKVENCTFFRMGEFAIVANQENVSVKVQIKNVTVHDAERGIYLNDVPDGIISNSIITKCRVYGVRTMPEATLNYIYTYQNRQDFRDTSGDTGCVQTDPCFYDANNGDFSILPGAACLVEDSTGGLPGDLRWTGVARLRAGQQK